MADEDQDDSQKTEDPTAKRLEDATKKGQVAFSREVTSFVVLTTFALILVWVAPSIMHETIMEYQGFIASPHLFRIDKDSIQHVASNVSSDFFSIMIVPFILMVVVILISAFLQNGFLLTAKPIMPQLERISPLKGISRIFSLKSFIELLKGLLKIGLVGAIGVIVVYPHLSSLQEIYTLSMLDMLKFLGVLATKMMIGICSLMGIIAVADLIYQRHEHSKSLRMSKRDIKDEFKQTEGSPEVKQKLREIRSERSQKRMMAAVPEADVVVTNPTHYSVALKYDEAIANAPIVVAKGKDFIALKIREVAKEHDIPLVENPPLARALFGSVDVEQEIPLEHYNAVAEIIRYVYKLKGKKF